MEFDRTESSHTEGKIEEATMRLQIGTVATVFEHTKKDDNSNFECNVILRDEEKERRRVKIMTPRKGEIHVPEKGDKVVVGFLDGETEDPIILGNFYNIQDRPPLGKSGMYRLKRGSLYLEAHPDGNWARITKKSSDDGTPSSRIEVDDSGSATKVNVEAEGDVIVNSSNGKVILGGTSGSEVARKGDPVEVDDPDSGTITGQITDGSENVDAA